MMPYDQSTDFPWLDAVSMKAFGKVFCRGYQITPAPPERRLACHTMDDGLAFWRQLGVTKPLPPNGLLHTERKRIAAGQLESPQNSKYTKAFASKVIMQQKIPASRRSDRQKRSVRERAGGIRCGWARGGTRARVPSKQMFIARHATNRRRLAKGGRRGGVLITNLR